MLRLVREPSSPAETGVQSTGDYASAAEATAKTPRTAALCNSDDRGWYLQEMARYHHRVGPHRVAASAGGSSQDQSFSAEAAVRRDGRETDRPEPGSRRAHCRVGPQASVAYAGLDVGRVRHPERGLFSGPTADKVRAGVWTSSAGRSASPASGLTRSGRRDPDNLWALDATQYLLWECKSEVDINRAEINRREAEQMNRSSAWFDKHYPGMSVKRIIVHPSNTVHSAAAFIHEVEAMREAEDSGSS